MLLRVQPQAQRVQLRAMSLRDILLATAQAAAIIVRFSPFHYFHDVSSLAYPQNKNMLRHNSNGTFVSCAILLRFDAAASSLFRCHTYTAFAIQNFSPYFSHDAACAILLRAADAASFSMLTASHTLLRAGAADITRHAIRRRHEAAMLSRHYAFVAASYFR